MSNTKTIRWVIFHEPIDLFLRTANAFCDEIEKNSNGRLNIEVYSMIEYAKKFHNGVVFDQAALINSGEVQMSQLYVSKIGEQRVSDFYALEMPFLFKDHDHATRVLEGEVGEFLLDKITAKSNVRGMAFTYSGGFRNVVSSKKVSTLKGLTDEDQN